jgi:hypothetical protein
VNRIYLIHPSPVEGEPYDIKFSIKTKPIFRRVYREFPLSLPKTKALHLTLSDPWTDDKIKAITSDLYDPSDRAWVDKFGTYLAERQGHTFGTYTAANWKLNSYTAL